MLPKVPSPACALLAAAALLACHCVSADDHAPQIVKWTDATGHVHFSDHAPPGHTQVTEVPLNNPMLIGSDSPPTTQQAPDSRDRVGTANADATAEPEDKRHL